MNQKFKNKLIPYAFLAGIISVSQSAAQTNAPCSREQGFRACTSPYTVVGLRCFEHENCTNITEGPYSGYKTKRNHTLANDTTPGIRPNMFTMGVLNQELRKCRSQMATARTTHSQDNCRYSRRGDLRQQVARTCSATLPYCRLINFGPYKGLYITANYRLPTGQWAVFRKYENAPLEPATREACIREGVNTCARPSMRVPRHRRYTRISVNCSPESTLCHVIQKGPHKGFVQESNDPQHQAAAGKAPGSPFSSRAETTITPKVLRCASSAQLLPEIKYTMRGRTTHSSEPTEATR